MSTMLCQCGEPLAYDVVGRSLVCGQCATRYRVGPGGLQALETKEPAGPPVLFAVGVLLVIAALLSGLTLAIVNGTWLGVAAGLCVGLALVCASVAVFDAGRR
jgi:uncharacterized membrane protein YdjX (TVP38/TMEM64 family)